MTRFDKLFEKLSTNPKNVRFEDLDTLLKRAGFTRRQPGRGGSHYVYTKPGCPGLLTVPKAKPLKAVYVRKALEFIEQYGEIE